MDNRKLLLIVVVLASIHALLLLGVGAKLMMPPAGRVHGSSIVKMFGMLTFLGGCAVGYAAYAMRNEQLELAFLLLAGSSLVLFFVAGPIAGIVSAVLAGGVKYVASQL